MTPKWIDEHYKENPSRKGPNKYYACSVCGWGESRGIHTGKENNRGSGIPFHDFVEPKT